MKVSLLSPVYNEAKLVSQMIASVQAQSHRDWELLFVDDGSSDSTHDIIDDAARSDERIKVVAHGRKVGKVRAFNRAYAAAGGDLIALLAGDDIIPPDSLAHRVAAFAEVGTADPAVAFFKMRFISDNPRYDGIVHPRGNSSCRCGGSTTMNRPLAELVFPIAEDLPSEDLWLRHATPDLASVVIERPDIVLHYRIHPGNSVPRGGSFATMTRAAHARGQSFKALLDSERLHLTSATREQLRRLWETEQMRYAGKPLRVLFSSDLPIIERMAMASRSNPVLHSIRSRYFKAFSGWRGQ